MCCVMKRVMVSAFFIAGVVLSGIGVATIAEANKATAAKAESSKAPFVHTVIFTLKPEVQKAKADELVADCHKMLTRVTSVKGIWAGKPSDKEPPAVVAKDYDVGLICLFEDADGMKKYLDDPNHVEFAQKWVPSLDMSKLKVYDFVNPK